MSNKAATPSATAEIRGIGATGHVAVVQKRSTTAEELFDDPAPQAVVGVASVADTETQDEATGQDQSSVPQDATPEVQTEAEAVAESIAEPVDEQPAKSDTDQPVAESQRIPVVQQTPAPIQSGLVMLPHPDKCLRCDALVSIDARTTEAWAKIGLASLIGEEQPCHFNNAAIPDTCPAVSIRIVRAIKFDTVMADLKTAYASADFGKVAKIFSSLAKFAPEVQELVRNHLKDSGLLPALDSIGE